MRTQIGKIVIVAGLALGHIGGAPGLAMTNVVEVPKTMGPVTRGDANQRYMLCAARRVNALNACVRRAGLKVAEAGACRRQFLTRLTFDLARCEKGPRSWAR